MTRSTRKEKGAYYTPAAVVSTLLRWVIRDPTDRLLDPSCGDGRFIAEHRNSVGIESDLDAAALAMTRAPWALIHEGDLFAWAANTAERFECAAGNPPFIRYQTFKGTVREEALRLCSALGADFSGLTSSWGPFLVATASLLKPGGRMAFVVPAEIGHAPYAAPVLEYCATHFARVQVIAVRDKLFPELSEDCWLLYADGFGGTTEQFHFTVLDRFDPTPFPPGEGNAVSVSDWRTWNRRLRPFLISQQARELYQFAASHPESHRFGDIASIGIGYVTGANDFFHFRPSEAERWRIPDGFLYPTVRNGRALPARRLTRSTVDGWRRTDLPMLLLRLPKHAEIPRSVSRYLDTEGGLKAREAYKCKTRDPWYSVPNVQIPDFFLSYMSGVAPSLVRNEAKCSCTNSVHSVHFRDRKAIRRVVKDWETPFVRLSCELEGHPLGGGVLKLEPGEATEVLFPSRDIAQELFVPEIADAVSTLRGWRHHVTAD